MFILLNPNIEAEWKNIDDRALDSFEWLILQHSLNSHYISASRSTVTFLEGSIGTLSRKTKEILSLIKTQSDDGIAIKNKLLSRIEITSIKSPNRPERHIENNTTIWKVSLLDACSWLSNRTNLLGENLDDTEAYEHAGKHFAVKNGLPPNNISLSHDITGGCGPAPSVVDRKMAEKRCPVILILDSDKLSPKHTGHASLTKCESREKIVGNIFLFKKLNTRELENAIPMFIIENAILSLPISPDRDKLLEELDALKTFKNNHPHHYIYIDLKNGTCKATIDSSGQVVEEFFSGIPAIRNCSCKSKSCSGVVSPPLCENILRKICDYLRVTTPQKIESFLDNIDSAEWLNVGAMVYSMGFVNKTRVT